MYLIPVHDGNRERAVSTILSADPGRIILILFAMMSQDFSLGLQSGSVVSLVEVQFVQRGEDESDRP